MKDSNEASEQLVELKPGYLWQYELLIAVMIGPIVGAAYNAQTSCSGILALVTTHVKPIPINYAMFVNPFATNAVNTTQMHSSW
jgi:hypothetical protein